MISAPLKSHPLAPKNNFSDEEFAECIKHIGYAMSELIDISNKLHRAFPDIVPDELK